MGVQDGIEGIPVQGLSLQQGLCQGLQRTPVLGQQDLQRTARLSAFCQARAAQLADWRGMQAMHARAITSQGVGGQVCARVGLMQVGGNGVSSRAWLAL